MTSDGATPISPAQNDRIMAAMAHVAVILPFWGLFAAIVIWVTQKEKSRFLAFQSLQAVAYQLAIVVIGMFTFGCYICSFLISFFPLFLSATNSSPSPTLFWTTLIPFAVIVLGSLVVFSLVVYGIIGTIMVFRGKDFRYIILGNRLEKYLEKGAG